jgi:hypothetical protein
VTYALATEAQFRRFYPDLSKNLSSQVINETLAEATGNLEERVDRRLAPFSGYTWSDRLYGIDLADPGGNAGGPLPWAGSLGLSFANALGSGSDLVRQFHLDQTAPVSPELWTYNIESITLSLSIGSTQTVDPGVPGALEGPYPDTGLCRMRLGTFAPEGTTIQVVYGGGYTLGVPPSLQRACRMQAAIFSVLDFEPQLRQGMDLTEMNEAILQLIAPWVKT